jgi:hypothetical protein
MISIPQRWWGKPAHNGLCLNCGERGSMFICISNPPTPRQESEVKRLLGEKLI